MGILDFFRKKSMQEKTVLELGKDKEFANKIETAFSSLLNFEDSAIKFLEDLEASAKAKKSNALRDAIEKHGFRIYSRYAGMMEQLDTERLAVMRFRSAKWNAIHTEAEKILEILTAIRQLLRGKKSALAEKAALSVLLREKLISLKNTFSQNLEELLAGLKKYPELIDRRILDKKFEEFKKQTNAKLNILNSIIEQLIIAEREITG
ncbi:MAG: hypothetical protein QXR48_03330 [Candidatus Woesearchaeota archaeon]